MASVSLKHIFKVYAGNVTAVSDFNLDIEDKEFIVLVGPSGCGKSTTLRMVAGLEEISSGELYIGDRLVNDVAPKDRDIAMVFQNYALYPHMTVFDNMAFGLKLRKVPKAEIKARVEENAKVLDIYHLLNRKPKALSGGQRQRVALGRAIVREPKVFLMDEPLSNLDAKLRVAMRTEITKLHQRLQTTVIYVTHDQTEAMTMGTRIVVMKDGFVQQVDSPQNLYDYPANLFVAGFIGSPQMNIFNVRLEKQDKDVVAVFGNNKIVIPPSKLSKFGDESVIGKEIFMGIRPENIHDEDVFVQAAPNAVIDCKVEVTELMGSETYLYLTTSGKDENIIARVNPRTTSRAGQT
ncbi:MAG: sn-glycerol-3-phosphate ABC transporter ATP-binding protein UgpC, partial [Candidatus Limiplasma sp.]|nr:sn-glycerol-3-phosphate ABC transporter ATP-binding protein UgpC [Candidatus Limiplasma sp.]